MRNCIAAVANAFPQILVLKTHRMATYNLSSQKFFSSSVPHFIQVTSCFCLAH